MNLKVNDWIAAQWTQDGTGGRRATPYESHVKAQGRIRKLGPGSLVSLVADGPGRRPVVVVDREWVVEHRPGL